MPNVVNEMLTREYRSSLEDCEGFVIVGLSGLTVAESQALRTSLAEQGVRLLMVRNKLVRRVLAERGHELAGDALIGNVAIAYGSTEQTIEAARIFSKTELRKAGKVFVRAGLLEDNLLDARDAAGLAEIPDRDTLHAQILGCIAGPARSLATVLQANPSAVARVLQARSEQDDRT